jgi:alditol oxidase
LTTATNWSGNYTYRARAIHAPSTTAELQQTIAALPRVRALGSRHSFSDLADSEELVSLDRLPRQVVVDRGTMTVSVNGAIRYGELAEELAREGLALHNLASLPHIAVAGAVATGTHGSGDGNGNLATAVCGLELVTSDGDIRQARRGDPDFDGMVVSLGAVGAITRVTLDVEPEYHVRQHVFEGMPWATLFEHFDEITASGYSVSVFTRWGEAIDQVWVKSRADAGSEPLAEQFFGASAARGDRHPILGVDPVNCTAQMGVPGRWSERLPHFKMGFTPSSGAEIQSEYILARGDAVQAIGAVREVVASFQALVQVSEIRTAAADALWMSPQYGQDTVAIHFTWERRQRDVESALDALEAALAPFNPRPHWGKLFMLRADAMRRAYARLPDFVALLERLDPRGAFRNPWLETHVLGDGAVATSAR